MAGTSDIDEPRPPPPMRRKLHLRQLDVLTGQLEALPALGEAAAAALRAASAPGDPACNEALAKAISRDRVVSAALVALAGTEATGGVGKAIAALGAGGACSGVLCVALGRTFARTGTALDREGFWKHCLAVAVCAESLAQRSQAISPPLAFACGLLHDVGKAALDLLLPKTYLRVLERVNSAKESIAGVERRRIGVDHAVVGRRLGRLWKLPACVEEVIWLHHHWGDAVPATMDSAVLIATVQLADTIVRRQNIGFSGNFDFEPTDELARRIGLTAADVSDARTKLKAQLAAREGLVRILTTADQTVTAPQGQRLLDLADAAKGDAVQLLRRFATRAGATTAVAELCREIARTYAALLPPAGVNQPVAAFAIVDDPPRATLAVVRGNGREAYRVSACRAVAAPVQAQPAREATKGLLESQDAWADLIDLDSAICLPLTSEGRWAGGVLIPAQGRMDPKLLEGLSDLMAFVLAAAQAREKAQLLAEQLGQATQHLSQTRQAMAEAEALAAVGEMAAGAAHEINTPLAVISGRAQLIAERAATNEDRRDAEKIVQRAQDISDIATELLAFARPPPAEPMAVDLAELMESVKKKLLSDSQPKTASPTVDIEIQPSCPPAWADAGQIEQVLVELADNAVSAAAAAGTKKVKLLMTAQWRPEPDRVLIAVADDGPGMDEATLAAAFSPLFSRRPAGRGRGMGLAHARRKVQANAGRIWIESRPGAGTRVFVELPRAARDR